MQVHQAGHVVWREWQLFQLQQRQDAHDAGQGQAVAVASDVKEQHFHGIRW
ncbi:hypothetical protein D3C72_2381480 [compost metagenome]